MVTRRRAAALLLGALAAASAAGSAAAHGLRIFARVVEGLVQVEARFSSGRAPKQGEVRVFDAADRLVLTLPLEDGEARFAPPEGTKDTGLRIEVHASDGHSDWWALTPADLAADQ